MNKTEINVGDRVEVTSFEGTPSPGEDDINGRRGTVAAVDIFAWVQLDEAPSWWQDDTRGIPCRPEELTKL